jgi:hypothetical protein
MRRTRHDLVLGVVYQILTLGKAKVVIFVFGTSLKMSVVILAK